MAALIFRSGVAAFQKLYEKGIRVENHDKLHQAVIEKYLEHDLTMIGETLDQLREKRVDADYWSKIYLDLAYNRDYWLELDLEVNLGEDSWKKAEEEAKLLLEALGLLKSMLGILAIAGFV